MKEPFKDAAIELVKIRRNIIESKRKVLIIFEGSDAAGKDSAIKRITKHNRIAWFFNDWIWSSFDYLLPSAFKDECFHVDLLDSILRPTRI